MAHKALFEELTEIGDNIAEALAADRKRSKASRNASYRAKRIKEATELWSSFNGKFTKLLDYVDANDTCLVQAQTKYKKIYTEYTDRLLQIPAEDQEEETQRTEDNEASDQLMRTQSKRFVSLKQILQEVLSKLDNEEIPSASYSTVKKQKIMTLWERIDHDDELIEEGSIGYNNYRKEFKRMEDQMDRSLIFLQEQIMAKSTDNSSEGLKLNRVELEKFGGDYFKWVTFKDLFTSMVINNKKVGKAEKMHRLKTHVTGEVSDMIQDLTVSEANFDCAWDRLMNRYNNERIIIGKMINKLLSQPNCKGDSKSVKKLLDTTDQMLLGLQNLNRPTEHWNDWIIVIISQKLDEETQKDWERKIGKATSVPSWEELKEFLEEQFRLMERIEGSNKKHERAQDKPNQAKSIKTFQTSIENACVICKESHSLYNCSKWKEMEPKERLNLVKKQKWCKRCLRQHEDKAACDKVCKRCKKGHSTWLHENRTEKNQLTAAHGTFTKQPYQILLATATIKTIDGHGITRVLRVLIDSGSEGSLITQAAATLLSSKVTQSDRWVQGLGNAKSVPLKKIHLTIYPRFESDFSLELDFYILKTLTKMLPGHNLDPTSWKHIKKLLWADPKFFEKGQIDALLGMDAIVDIMKAGIVRGPKGQPMAQDTQLGWVISGKIDPTYPTEDFKCLVNTNEVQNDLHKFWEIEDLNPERALTEDEIECEQHYEKTVRQHANGKFIVSIPFKQNSMGPERLGDSKGQAIARFLQVEKRFAREKFLDIEYKKVIKSYIDMGHMKEVTNQPKEEKLYYIPHHAVVKPDHLTTKVRVVFDASARTTSGWSLNDCMHIGAKQQRDLSDILINWRLFEFVYKADIEKMYRMIELSEGDQRFHTIVWRNSPAEALKEYQLTTTTFGTAAAPFLATRTLVQIANERKETHPLASTILKNNFYVDDLLGGNHSLAEANQCKDELLTVLNEHHLPLRKWSSNSQEFLANLPEEMTEQALKQSIFEDETSKALGLLWNPQSDGFSYKINWLKPNKTSWTKREFLSETSKLFDPLGWLAPITINAKLLMQEVWTKPETGWDDLIPDEVAAKWLQFRKEFHELEQITIKRWIQMKPNSDISLHGFSDASEKAYSAVIYVRVVTNDDVNTALITAKTRVAPIKSKLTLPQLELCGALLVAELMQVVIKSLFLNDPKVFLWTDSMITLGWVRSEPRRWKTFVANRVAKIQATPMNKWNYVPTDQNPADCASRGIMPLDLVQHSLWWTGPSWLTQDPQNWPSAAIQDHDLEQRKDFMVNVAQFNEEPTNDTVESASSWFKLRRISAYCRRFKNKNSGPLSVDEIKTAEYGLIKHCQNEYFFKDMQELIKGRPVNNKSKLRSLNVFLDERGIIRVGGRLTNAQLPYSVMHPIVLPSTAHLTKIIIHQMHLDTHHGGPKIMKHLLKRRFWIIQATRLIHNEYAKCIICTKHRGESYKQQMADLPAARVTLDRPFGFSGVDYAGPIEVKSSSLRNAKIIKGYIAVFVCMGTKAVHLELVGDQTTKAFLAAFDRFTARRGLPKEMFSDNGSNFEGANNQLKRLFYLEQNQTIAKVMVNNEVKWNFIPPGSPNFGGLWERAVRSMKDHIWKTLQTARLTFEEYSTLLCQVEACLNSRPLCSVSDDIDNLEVLTPGHFLIGQELLARPHEDMTAPLTNNRDRWKYVQWLQHQLWLRWNREYLSELQQRHKWQEKSENAKPGDIVAVKDEDLAPRNWLVGRIEETFKGQDNRVRVATIRVPAKNNSVKSQGKTKPSHGQSKIIQRPIRKLCPLIVEEKEEEIIKQHTKIRQPKKKYNLRPRAAQLLTMALLFFGLIFGAAATNKNVCFTATKFNDNAGIYFEDIGRATMTKSEWKMQVYFDLDRYYDDISMVNSTINQLDNLCKVAEGAISNSAGLQCSHTIKLIQSQFDEIIQMNVILQQNKQIAPSRPKRAIQEISEINWIEKATRLFTNADNHSSGNRTTRDAPLNIIGLIGSKLFGTMDAESIEKWENQGHRTTRAAPFNFIGWIGSKLFGIMDAESAEKLENRIEQVKTGMENMSKLIMEQTSIVELTKNLLKESHEDASQKFKILANAIDALSNETDLYRKRDQILGWALYTSLILNKLEKVQHNIVNMLTDLQQGHVSSYLFTPQQLKQELDKINDLIPNGHKLPINPQTDIKAFYELMRGRMRVTKKHILLEILLPLVSVEEFQVFHIVPVPVEHKTERICIIPESPYLMINLKRNLFYQMSSEDLDNCIKTQDIPMVCPARQMAESILSTKSKCERELLSGSNNLQHCQINVVPESNVWIHLKSTNNWIYGLRNSTVLNIIEGSNVDTVTLQGNGILQIQPGCEISHGGSTITGQAQITTTSFNHFLPALNLSDVIPYSELTPKVINLTTSHDDWVQQVNANLQTLDHVINKHHHQHSIIQLVIALFIIGILVFLTLIIKHKSKLHTWWLKLITSPATNTQNGTITSTVIDLTSVQPPSTDEHNDDTRSADQHSHTRHGPGGCPFMDMRN